VVSFLTLELCNPGTRTPGTQCRVSWQRLTDRLDAMQKTTITRPCRDTNPGSSAVQPVVLQLYQLSYPGSPAVSRGELEGQRAEEENGAAQTLASSIYLRHSQSVFQSSYFTKNPLFYVLEFLFWKMFHQNMCALISCFRHSTSQHSPPQLYFTNSRKERQNVFYVRHLLTYFLIEVKAGP
jgi:hypothetical protein